MSNLLGCLSHLEFGHGKVVVQTATVDGKHSLIINHAIGRGEPGSDAMGLEPSAVEPSVMSRSVVLTFQSEDHCNAVHDALMGKV